jgi:glycosyltransferase involved in cell wall biosynthesis
MLAAETGITAIVPVYNEVDTLAEIVQRLEQVALIRQIVLVDDASTDGSRELIRELCHHRQIDARFHDCNQGKGAAIRTGLPLVEQEHLIIQDADLEYDPQDICDLAEQLGSGVRVVYGSRLLGTCTGMKLTNYLGNRLLTMLFNLLYSQCLSDVETCYKLCSTTLLRQVGIEGNRFDFDPELSAKLARCGEPIVEVPISYRGRTCAEGKKIAARDAVSAIRAMWHYRSWLPADHRQTVQPPWRPGRTVAVQIGCHRTSET